MGHFRITFRDVCRPLSDIFIHHPIAWSSRPKTHSLLVFIHGNGLTKSCFRPTIAALFKLNESNTQHALHCVSFDLPGHGESEDTGELLEHFTTYAHFGQALADKIEAFCAQSSAKYDHKILVAHSIGYQMILLAQRRLKFEHAVLVEPISTPMMEGGGRFPAPEHFIKGCLTRRRTFPSFQAAYDAMRPKGMYAAWDTESVELFVFKGGLRRVAAGDGQEVELCCHPHLEAKIYALDMSEIAPELPSMKFKSSVVMVGSTSKHMPHEFFHLTANVLGAKVVLVEGVGHTIPCERPQVVAQEVFNTVLLAQQQQQQARI